MAEYERLPHVGNDSRAVLKNDGRNGWDTALVLVATGLTKVHDKSAN